MCLPVGPGASIGSITALAALPALDVRELGPELGGRLDGIVVLADGTILVASPGGGVWRRPFDSLSWEQPANRGLIDYTIQHLEFDLLDPAIVYAVGRNGLFRTANRGDDWELLVGGAIAPVLPSTDAVDPAPFAQLRVSESDRILFWSYPCRGLYWSLDSLRWRRARIDPDAASSPDNCLAQIVA
ncbi:MAG: hypothetical protein HUU20_06455, partial [Pirellulales bacterium]|nr:hypothetical protein [Pirellulales bacterium]